MVTLSKPTSCSVGGFDACVFALFVHRKRGFLIKIDEKTSALSVRHGQGRGKMSKLTEIVYCGIILLLECWFSSSCSDKGLNLRIAQIIKILSHHFIENSVPR